MRADRLLSILLLLQVHRRLTARELAERLEVSQRTIYRDMMALSVAGIPVVTERGVGGGCFLLEGYQTNLTGLNESEIKTLFLSKPSRLLADLGLRQASEAALIKLLAALPAMQRRDAEYVRQRIHIEAAGWNPSEENVSLLPTLQEAIWQERKLRFSYQRSDGTIVEQLVEPLGLVAKGSVWYLMAAIGGEIYTYRVSRVQSAEVTEQPFVRPQAFNLAACWEQSYANFKAALPRYPATVRISPTILSKIRNARGFAHIERVDPPDAEGWIKVSIIFETEEEACKYVLSFSSQIEVLEPQALCQKIIHLVEQVAALYSSPLVNYPAYKAG